MLAFACQCDPAFCCNHASWVYAAMDIIIITIIVVMIPLYGLLKWSPLFVKGTFLSHVIHFHVVNTDGDRHFRHFWGIFPTLMVIVAAHMANWHY